MADNLTTPIPAGTKLATKEITTDLHLQKTMLMDGSNVDAIGDVGASPAANTILGRLKAIVDKLTSGVGVTGTFFQATQPVSAASLPLPAGAATEATLAAASGKLPATLGIKTAAASLSVTPASDAAFALAASETLLGSVSGPADLIDVTLVLDTSVYATGDVLSDTVAITNAARINGGRMLLHSLIVIDEDDQGQPLDLMFFGASQSLGTVNAAPSITDAAARDCQGAVSIASTDWIDLGGVRIATIKNIGLFLEAAAGSRSLFVGSISRGTGTYTASGLKLRLGFVQN